MLISNLHGKSSVTSVITVFNQKGGVGKTTTSLNLAAAMARRGHRPLMIDLDPQAHLTHITGASVESSEDSAFSFFAKTRSLNELVLPARNNMRIVPAHLDLAKADTLFGKSYNVVTRLAIGLRAEALQSEQEPVVIDCCPMLGVLSLNALFAGDSVIIPIATDFLSLNGAMQVEKTLKALEQVLKKRLPRRYLLTRFDRRRKMSTQVQEQARERFGADLCQTVISENVSVAESPALNKDIFEHAPTSRGARDYQALLDELFSTGFVDRKAA